MVGPFKIKQDEIKGFEVLATKDLEKGTIICEYAGEVITCEESKIKVKNDSIYELLRANQSKYSLDICPMKYGNMARFINGINNQKFNHRWLDNVEPLRFCYKGRLRLIFWAKQKLTAG